jgi:hypothetical protein
MHMARTVFALVCVCGLLLPVYATDPPADQTENGLAIQTTIFKAKDYLFQSDPRKAVELLESQLPRINGHRQYLLLMRDAYRDYVKHLYLADQGDLAEKYRKRLAILDPDGADKLRPALPAWKAVKAPEKAPVAPPPQPESPVLAQLAETPTRPTSTAGSSLFPKRNAPVAVARAKDLDEDPFRRENEIKPAAALASDGARTRLQGMLARAEKEFGDRHFNQAKLLFDQIHQSDPGLLSESREHWAYCILFYVVEQLKRSEVAPQALTQLEGEVRHAMSLAPAMPGVAAQGKSLLEVIQGMRGAPAPQKLAAIAVKHFKENQAGWRLAETANFRIFHSQSPGYAEQVAQLVERVRSEMHHKWFGGEPTPWTPKCDVVIHATPEAYQKATGVSRESPGHASIGLDRSTGRVATRRIDFPYGSPALMTDVLPHEATHVVLGGNFGKFEVPRWADEGMAVLSETETRIEAHRRNLAKALRDGKLMPVKAVITSKDYPHPSQVMTFYAQSTALVEYLTKLAGPETFARFVRDGLEGKNYEEALRKHYNVRDFNELEQRWRRHIQVELASR